MVFDDDAKLFGLYSRFCDEEDQLKKEVVNYIKGDCFGENIFES